MIKKRRNTRTMWKKRIWQDRINYTILGVLVLIVLVGSVYCRKVELNNERELQAVKTTDQKSAKQDEKADTAEASEKQATEDLADNRANFAVNPDIPCGAYSENDEKIVYLTFDDGPSEMTQRVLDILDKYNAKATFFVTNTNSNYADMIKKAYDKGHTIGLHTGGHDYNYLYSSKEAYFDDLNAIAKTVEEQIGYVPCFIRFPGGTSNTIISSLSPGLMSELIQDVRKKGYQYYDWNWTCGDGGVHTADELVAQANQCVDNNIVLLCHDSSTKQTTVDALPKIIEHYTKEGYQFKAIDRESYVAHHMGEETL